jgi:hypothetical protein
LGLLVHCRPALDRRHRKKMHQAVNRGKPQTKYF